jgi:hypothetical protein
LEDNFSFLSMFNMSVCLCVILLSTFERVDQFSWNLLRTLCLLLQPERCNFNFRHTVITTWRMRKLLRWKRRKQHVICDPDMIYTNNSLKKLRLCKLICSKNKITWWLFKKIFWFWFSGNNWWNTWSRYVKLGTASLKHTRYFVWKSTVTGFVPMGIFEIIFKRLHVGHAVA